MSRRLTFLVATLIGLSHIVVLSIAPVIADLLRRAFAIPFRGAIELTVFVLSLTLSLLVLPLALRNVYPTYGDFAKASGVTLTTGGFVFALGGFLLTLSLNFATGHPPGALVLQLGRHLGATRWSALGAIQPPIVEEVLIRGVVLGLLLRNERPWMAIAWSSALFGIWHSFLGPSAVLSIAIASVFLFAIPRLLSKSVLPGVAAHFLTTSGVVFPTIWGFIVLEAAALAWSRYRAMTKGSA